MSVPELNALPDSHTWINRPPRMTHAPNPALKLLLLLLLVGGAFAIARADTINEAIHRGDIATVRRMLRFNPRLVAFRGTDSNTPLHWAAWDGRADVARLLVDDGADVNDRRAMDGGTPLWLAAWQGRTDVVGGLPLLHTTFQNPSFTDHGKYLIQAYPDEYPGNHYRPRTGAVEVDKLGFPANVDGVSTSMDAVYEIGYTFSHTGGELAIDFAAHDLEALDNESWGIANVHVSVANDVPIQNLVRHTTTVPTTPVHLPTRVVAHVVVHRASQPQRHVGPRRVTRTVKKPTASHPATRLHQKEKPPGL